MKVITRIAPSPTGFLHFGLARTALFNFLYSKKNSGEFVIRIEDTDTARNKPEYESDIHEQLTWLGLVADRTYRQSDHIERHKECLAALIAGDKAYVSREPAKDDPDRIVEVVRLRNPGEKITFTDVIRGDITFDTTELKDFVIARSVNEPLYHFAVVVDDHDEGITHVIRGDDHISNTPRQILILRALGFEIPVYAHLPLILMPDKSKMSKRKHESSVRHYRNSGILPEALINYIALLGWSPKSGKEILGIDEMTQEFELESLHKSGAVFDAEKLRWVNKEYLNRMPEEVFQTQALRHFTDALAARGVGWDESIASKLVPILKERIHAWNDVQSLVKVGEFDFFFNDPQLIKNEIPQKGTTSEEAVTHLKHIASVLNSISENDFSTEQIKDALWNYATEQGRGKVLWPFRFSLSARQKSPDPFVISSIIGKESTLRRVTTAIEALGSS